MLIVKYFLFFFVKFPNLIFLLKIIKISIFLNHEYYQLYDALIILSYHLKKETAKCDNT